MVHVIAGVDRLLRAEMAWRCAHCRQQLRHTSQVRFNPCTCAYFGLTEDFPMQANQGSGALLCPSSGCRLRAAAAGSAEIHRGRGGRGLEPVRANMVFSYHASLRFTAIFRCAHGRVISCTHPYVTYALPACGV